MFNSRLLRLTVALIATIFLLSGMYANRSFAAELPSREIGEDSLIVSESDLGLNIELKEGSLDRIRLNSNIIIAAPTDSQNTQFKLQTSELVRTAEKYPKMVLTAKAGSSSISLALAELSDVINEKDMPSAETDLIIRIFEQVSEIDVAVSEEITFSLNLAMGEELTPIEQLGTMYTERRIEITGFASSSSTIGTLLTDKGESIPVPTVFSTENGKKIAVLKHNTLGTYVLQSNYKNFADTKGHWAQSSIELLSSKLLVVGKSPLKFDPNAHVTRAEFSQLLTRILGLTSMGEEINFVDVEEGKWYHKPIATAAKAGLVKGYEDGTFKPSKKINREEMIAMVYNALLYIEKSPNSALTDAELNKKFSDYKTSGVWARPALSHMLKLNLVYGTSDGILAPKKTATRAEAVTILRNAFEYAGFLSK